MATMTDESVELDVDLDAVVPCAAEDCETVAAWSAVQHCPVKHSYPLCEDHKVEAEEQLRHAQAIAAMLGITGLGHVHVTCNLCPPDAPDLTPPYITWRKL